jgi:hypothetical protein
MENKDGVPGGKRLSRFARQDHTTTKKGMTSVVDRHRFYAEPYQKNVGKAVFFSTSTFIYRIRNTGNDPQTRALYFKIAVRIGVLFDRRS